MDLIRLLEPDNTHTIFGIGYAWCSAEASCAPHLFVLQK